jgi:hypothetical protein
VAVGLAVVGLPYVWILWDLWSGTADPFRALSPSNIYDLQGRAMLAGHLSVPAGSLGIEGFLHDGREYSYFGLFPSILRLPVLAVTHAYDGRLTAPSMLLAWCVTGLFAALLLWRLRTILRGSAPLGRAEAVAHAVLVAAVCGGSVLDYLAGSPKVYHEDLAWSVALSLGTLFALLGVVERPGRRRVVGLAVLLLCTVLDRSTTGYACAIAVLGRGGDDHRRPAAALAAIGVGSLAVSALVSEVKLGLAFGLSESNQVWTHVNAHRRRYLAANGGSAFGLRFLPTTVDAYLRPFGISVSSHFPFLGLPTGPAPAVGHVVLDQSYPTASVEASMPLLSAGALWGLVAAFRPSAGPVRVALRLLLVAMATCTVGVLCIGYVDERYLADFLPFLALGAMVGSVDLWGRLAGRSHRTRSAWCAVVAVLGVLSVWINVGAAVTPSGLWTSVQARTFVATQSDLGGTPAVTVVHRLPYWAPAGSLEATPGCTGLYVSNGFDFSTVPGQQLQHETWLAVSQAAGDDRLVSVTWTRPFGPAAPPVVLAVDGRTRLLLVPAGTDVVRMVLVHAGPASLDYPPADAGPVAVRPGVVTRFEILSDPYLQSITASGLGVAVQHYLPGSATLSVPTTQAPGVGAVVTSRDRPATGQALCRRLVAGA